MVDPEAIKKMLLIDESRLQEEVLAQVAPHLGVDGHGNVHLYKPEAYVARDAILLALIGRRFAQLAGLCPTDSLDVSEVASALGLDPKVAGTRLAELKNDQKVEATARGTYRISMARARQVLVEINLRRQKPNDLQKGGDGK